MLPSNSEEVFFDFVGGSKKVTIGPRVLQLGCHSSESILNDLNVMDHGLGQGGLSFPLERVEHHILSFIHSFFITT